MSEPKTVRRHPLRAYLQPKTLTMLALGFSSGLPFLLVGNTSATGCATKARP
jgi:hypothetical protein